MTQMRSASTSNTVADDESLSRTFHFACATIESDRRVLYANMHEPDFKHVTLATS
jgi:hypothetical protein